MKLASFDIFDTTLVRKCGRPENVFFLLSKQLFPDDEGMQRSFYMWRIQAEQVACQRFAKSIVGLREIYDGFGALGFGTVSEEDAIKSEKDMESLMLTSNKSILEKISSKRSEGFTICFVSDMYIDSSLLKEILIREGCAEKQDVVFVSCEYGKSKADGSLYDAVRDFYGAINFWEHFGDNKQSDYIICRKKGILARYVDTSYTRTELFIESEYKKYPFGKTMSVLIGMQRSARLHLSESDVDYTNAADFVASLYIPYLLYVFRQARLHHIERLYFLSRDSYLLYEMALSLREEYPDIECKYLYLSRRSLALPTLNDLDSQSIGKIMGGYDSLNGFETEPILRKLQLDELIQQLPIKVIKDQKDEKAFLSYLALHEEVISRKRQESRFLLYHYFRQEGVLDSHMKMAMVDVGWFGSTRLMVNSIRSSFSLSEIPFFYLGCRDDVLSRKYGMFYTFLPPEFVTTDLTYLIESYYSSSYYPSVIGYQENNSCIEPVFEKEDLISQKVSIVNACVCKVVLGYLREMPYHSMIPSMDVWGVAFISLFKKAVHLIDYSRLKDLRTPDGDNLIETISPIGLLRYLYEGHTGKACLQKNSIYYSYRIVWSENYHLQRWIMWLKHLVR
ncbi:hypothetical protein SAMN04487902_101424 [Prevotella sp. ne3005]|uniref:hypothetical protein n=1 Tax=Prevotella sp. ne3005 TaxID=1761887 RepID=UPI0008D2C1E5|nr:hypothetical protein [Prevotella sp. ne3005]SEM55264.1 hypothetical protein SAMN04487902_101424 [Prevotella sp. ne3005]